MPFVRLYWVACGTCLPPAFATTRSAARGVAKTFLRRCRRCRTPGSSPIVPCAGRDDATCLPTSFVDACLIGSARSLCVPSGRFRHGPDAALTRSSIWTETSLPALAELGRGTRHGSCESIESGDAPQAEKEGKIASHHLPRGVPLYDLLDNGLSPGVS